MPTPPGPYDLHHTRLIFGPDQLATPKQVGENFYAELGDFAGRMLVSRHDFDEPWSTWEVHPKGDEFVYLLSGDTDFLLKTPEGEKRLRVNQPGQYVVVPRATWHTAVPHAPTSMLFVTPGEGTLNAETPE